MESSTACQVWHSYRSNIRRRKLVMKDKESFIDEGQHSGNAWEWHQVRLHTLLTLIGKWPHPSPGRICAHRR